MSDKQCYHCGLPVPKGAEYQVEIDGRSRPMCCHGCQAVAQAIVDGGLTTFYQHREAPSRKAEDLVPEELQRRQDRLEWIRKAKAELEAEAAEASTYGTGTNTSSVMPMSLTAAPLRRAA